MGPRTWQILLVEDEPADAEFTEYSFGQGAHHHQITVHQTGASALSFLESTERSRCFPDLILLDINLPDVTGAELVGRIRRRSYRPLVPIIILSTSTYWVDIEAAYLAGANAYVQKPARLADFEELVRSIEQFWFDKAILPPSEEHGLAN